MCEPTTLALASAGMATAKIGLEYMGGLDDAARQDSRYAQNAANVRESVANNIESEQLSTLQTAEAAGRDKLANQKNGLKARAAATVAAGESGVTGLSVDALVRDVYGQEADNASAIDQQAEFKGQQSALELNNISITGRSQINQVRRGQKPSAAAALLQLASVGVDTMSSMSGKV